MLCSLKKILLEANKNNQIIPAFNVFGFEDASVIIKCAEKLNAPVILASNLNCIEHLGLDVFASIMRTLGEKSTTKVCIHLDHGKDYETCAQAIKAGYTSIMFDGSQLDLQENIKQTKEIAKMAHAMNIDIEAEIGSVGYDDPNMPNKAFYTDVQDAIKFCKETNIDAIAIAIGTVHRMTKSNIELNYNLLNEIEKNISLPIVIHGGTGIKQTEYNKIKNHNIAKLNIGTSLRMAFGNTLKTEINKTDEFDRIKLFQKPMQEVEKLVKYYYQEFGFSE